MGIHRKLNGWHLKRDIIIPENERLVHLKITQIEKGKSSSKPPFLGLKSYVSLPGCNWTKEIPNLETPIIFGLGAKSLGHRFCNRTCSKQKNCELSLALRIIPVDVSG